MNYLFISIICTLLFSCKLNSKEIAINTKQIDSSENSLVIIENRKALFSAIKESSTLSNYGSEVYRFILVTPFKPITLFRLVSNDSGITLTIKHFYTRLPDGQGTDTLLSSKELKLPESAAENFTSEFHNSMFWNLKSDTRKCILDATYWDMEAYDKFESNSNGYNHIVLYHRKMGPIWKIYNILMNTIEIKF